MKYKINIKEQSFEFGDHVGFKNKINALMDMGIVLIETEIIKDTKDTLDTKDTETVKIYNNSRKSPKKKATKNKTGRKSKYPEELAGFLKKNIENMDNGGLVKEVKKKFNLNFTKKSLADFMNYRGIKRKVSIHSKQISKKKLKKPETEDEYEIGIHLDHNGKYACNEFCNANPSKLSKDWKKINCKNCKRKFGKGEELENKIYTKERVDWLRENYSNSNISREELHELFNEEFDLDMTFGSVKGALKSYKIKKDYESIRKLKKESPDNEKYLPKNISVYKKEIIDFIRKCANEGLTVKETREKCQVEFEHPFSLESLRHKAHEKGISFTQKSLGLNLNEIDEKKLTLINKYIHLPNYEIRDKLIEEFGKGMTTTEIRKIVSRLKVNIANKENIKEAFKNEGKPKFTDEIERTIEKNYELMTDKELSAEIWDQHKERFPEEEIRSYRKKAGLFKSHEIGKAFETEGNIADALDEDF